MYKYKFKYFTLTQLGMVFGVSSHEVGRWLVEAGLRTEKGKPSREAFQGQFCETGPSRGGNGYCWVWDAEKTVAALKEAGHKPVSLPPLGLVEPPPLEGPFSRRQCLDGKIEILNKDESTSIIVLGEKNAVFVAQLLNVAHRLGKVPAKEGPPPIQEQRKAN